MGITRKQIIDAAKQSGFEGSITDPVAVKSHITSEIEAGSKFVVGSDELTADNFDSAWANVQTISLSPTSSVTERAEAASLAAKSGGPNRVIMDAQDTPKPFSIGNSARKSYSRKIAAGKAVFTDADEAEAFGAYARKCIMGNFEYAQARADADIVKKTQTEGLNTGGGATVPIEFMNSLIWLTEQYGVTRQLASVWKMSRDTIVVPRKTSIPTMTYTAEAAAITAADAAYDNVQLVARKGTILTQISNELLQDSAINIADDTARSIAEAVAIGEDSAYFLGDGTSTYGNQTGLTAALPSGAYINASGGSWSAVTAADIFGIMGSVQNVNTARLAFVCSRQFFVQVMMKLDNATSQFRELITGNLGGSATWKGYPVYFSQVMPTATAATQRCLYFGDFQGASCIGDRQQLSIATSEHRYFDQDMIAVRGTTRFNTVIHGDGRASTVGPIAALVTT
jgi:HK97 family phage major capsid protein